MPPFSFASNGVIDPVPIDKTNYNPNKNTSTRVSIVWRNIFLFFILHSSIVYGLYALYVDRPWKTVLFATILGFSAGLGVTAGAHRAYKAKLPLRLFLTFLQTLAGQNDIHEWCRDHRVHHKFSETDADPHNAKRGFFFSHMGWLCVRKHPDVIKKGKTVDMSDLLRDPIIRFQKNFYYPLVILCNFLIPTVIPSYFWGEKIINSFMIASLARYCISLHMTWLVNSAAHMWGFRPYDDNIGARENKAVAIAALGEGYHNYHHTFPWDYSTSELGWSWNFTTFFIDTMAKIGLAYDLKKASPQVVLNRKNRIKAKLHPY